MALASTLSCLLWLLEMRPSLALGLFLGPAALQLRGVNGSRNSTFTAPMTAPAAITSAANFHCDYRGQELDLGIVSPHCICGTAIPYTETWPALTPSAWIAENDIVSQCAYTAAPACLSCTSIGYYLGKCVSITNCDSITTSIGLSAMTSASTRRISTSISNASSSLTTMDHPNASVCTNSSSNSSISNGTCILQNAYCSLEGSVHALDDLTDVCVLWDESCCGNTALAPQNYWNHHLSVITSNDCFVSRTLECTQSNLLGRMSAFAGLKDWMRSPQCFASNPDFFGDTNGVMFIQQEASRNLTCCGNSCEITADKVDVYYWPDPAADTSCMSIVGDGTSFVADGATKDSSGHYYWGCDVWGTGLGPNADQSSTFIKTATLASIANISYKSYLYNPWDPSQCGNSSIQPRNKIASLYPRGHSLLVNNSDISTTVLDSYTFTSPSIYLNFQGLKANDDCGNTYIPSTMVAFSPGELSTITGQIGEPYGTPQAFDTKDLPCPPYSIMSQNWYTPLPGVPYRPYFAFPQKLREISDLKYCDAFFFSVFDPPRILGPASAMISSTTTADAGSIPTAPLPSPKGDQPAQATLTPIEASMEADPAIATQVYAKVTDLFQVPLVSQSFLVDPTTADQSQGYISETNKPNANINSALTSPTLSSFTASQHALDPNTESPSQMSTLHQVLDSEVTTDLRAQATANQVSNKLGPSDPDSESPAYMSALHEVLDPISPASPQEQATETLLGVTQNFGYTIQIDRTINSDASIQTTNKPGSQNEDFTATNSQSEPRHNSALITIHMGSNTNSSYAAPGLGAIVSDAVGASNSLQNDPSSTILTIAGHTITANPSSFDIAGTPVVAGEPGMTISGTPISLGSSGNLVLGATADAASTPTTVAPSDSSTIDTQGYGMVIATNSVAVGNPAITLAGTPVSLGASGVLVVGSSTTTLADSSPSSVFTVGGQVFTANPEALTLAGTALSAGGPGTTISGTPISLGLSGNLAIGSSVVTLTGPTHAPVFEVGGQSFIADPHGLMIAGPASDSSEPSRIGSITIPLIGATPSVFSTDGQTFTVDNAGHVAIGGTTLTNGGPAATVNGLPMSVASDALLIGTATIPPASSITTPLEDATQSVFTTLGQTFTIEGYGKVANGDITLTNGGSGTTINGIPMRVDSDALLIGTATAPSPSQNSVVTIDGHVLTMEGSGSVAVDGITLTNGGAATTISGIPMSVGPEGLVIGINPNQSLAMQNGSASHASNSSGLGLSLSPSSSTPGGSGIGKPQAGTAPRGASVLRLEEWCVLLLVSVVVALIL